MSGISYIEAMSVENYFEQSLGWLNNVSRQNFEMQYNKNVEYTVAYNYCTNHYDKDMK